MSEVSISNLPFYTDYKSFITKHGQPDSIVFCNSKDSIYNRYEESFLKDFEEDSCELLFYKGTIDSIAYFDKGTLDSVIRFMSFSIFVKIADTLVPFQINVNDSRFILEWKNMKIGKEIEENIFIDLNKCAFMIEMIYLKKVQKSIYMIPSNWVPYHRKHDKKLISYISQTPINSYAYWWFVFYDGILISIKHHPVF